MATLTINIDVSDEDFKKLCVDNINELPKEQMQEILLKAVEVALIRDKQHPIYDSSSCILVTQIRDIDGYSYKYEPTELLKSAMQNIDTEKYFKPIADEIAQYIKDNYRTLIQEYMVSSFMKLLFTDNNKYKLEEDMIRHINSRLGNR